MNRFSWYTEKSGDPKEDVILRARNVSLYDGHQKNTQFERGILTLTPRRIIWMDPNDLNFQISLDHSMVIRIERVPNTSFFGKSGKLVVSLHSIERRTHDGPVAVSSSDFIRISFKDGNEEEFYNHYMTVLKKFQQQPISNVSRRGISGIEEQLKRQHARTSNVIKEAFEDMSKLMDQARNMVKLSKTITEWINLKRGDFTEDEIVKFKSYLLSLGVDDPVTKECCGSDDEYFKKLAGEVSKVLLQPIKEAAGNMMMLPEAYCRINRARGVNLISPEDLLNACNKFVQIGSPLCLHTFDSGLSVIELRSADPMKAIEKARDFVETNDKADAQQLAIHEGIPVVVALEKLLIAEKMGDLCRDDTIEGLMFYPNKFK